MNFMKINIRLGRFDLSFFKTANDLLVPAEDNLSHFIPHRLIGSYSILTLWLLLHNNGRTVIWKYWFNFDSVSRLRRPTQSELSDGLHPVLDTLTRHGSFKILSWTAVTSHQSHGKTSKSIHQDEEGWFCGRIVTSSMMLHFSELLWYGRRWPSILWWISR